MLRSKYNESNSESLYNYRDIQIISDTVNNCKPLYFLKLSTKTKIIFKKVFPNDP